MANEFTELKLIARKALPRLIENLVMPNLCNRDFNDTYADLGDTIQIKKPVELEAKDFKPGDTATAQDIKEKTVEVKMDKIATVDVDINVLQAVHNMNEQKLMADFIEPAVTAIAQKINKAGIDMVFQTPNLLGTAGTTPDGLDDFAAARKFLNKAKAPLDNRYAVWDVEADAKFTQIGNLVKVCESGSPMALREGEIGRVFGLNNFMTQAIEKHEVHGDGTILLAAAATKGDTAVAVDGLTAGFEIGDRFTITGDTTVYTVCGIKVAFNETATTETVNVVPAIQKNAVDNTAVTAGSDATNNLIFHRDAITFVTRPLNLPKGVDAYVTNYGDYSLRVVRGYDMATKTEKLSMDVLYNYAMTMPELACAYLG